MLDCGGGAHGAAAAANAITSNRFSYSMNLKANKIAREDAPTAKPKQHARVCEGASMTIDTACSSSLACTFVISKLAVSRSPTVSATTVQASTFLQAGPVRNQSEVCTHVSKLHLRFKDYEPMPASIVNGPSLRSAAFRQAGNLQQAARLQRLEPHAVSWALCRVLRSRYAES